MALSKIATYPLKSKLGRSGTGRLPIQQSALRERNQESEAIASLFYNSETMEMQIEFNKRGTYSYPNFPPDVYADFNTASSRGTYFNLYIRNAGYEYERIG